MDIEKTNMMLQVLDWSYEKALNGLPGTSSAIDLAKEYSKGDRTLTEKVNTLIHWQMSNTATTGFVTGLGGLITLPISLPADIGSAVYIQMRMIAAIAYMGGYDLKDDKVKTLIYICLVGESAKDILKDVGIQIGVNIGQNLIKSLPTKILTKINQRVGFRLVTKFGTKGAINLVKIVPVFGGIIGGSINAITTYSIGNIAVKTFISIEEVNATPTDQVENIDAITDITSIEKLMFYTYLNLIKIDGVKRVEEFEIFETLIGKSLLDDNTRRELMQKLKSNELDIIDYSQLKENSKQAFIMLKNLILIANSDGEFHLTERSFIANIAKELDYSEQDIEALFPELSKQ
jgi:uncharacterized protein (DUF697 family)